jgi:hypothetical protein
MKMKTRIKTNIRPGTIAALCAVSRTDSILFQVRVATASMLCMLGAATFSIAVLGAQEPRERAVPSVAAGPRGFTPPTRSPALGLSPPRATGSTQPLPIVGGTFEPDYLYPWVVRLPSPGCGGVLLDPQWVLTAAHCLQSTTGVGKIVFRRTDPYTGVLVEDSRDHAGLPQLTAGAFPHPDFNPNTLVADIGLVKLAKPITPTPYIQTVGLPTSPRQQGVVGAVASISHNGALPPGQIAVLRAPIPYADGSIFSFYTPRDSSASGCPGDSGSGFVTVENGRATVRGIMSAGSITADCMTPSGYTDLTDVFTYHDWILQTIGKDDASLAGNTRVRWSGPSARGVIGVDCVVATANYPPNREGPLNVVGVEEGVVCQPGQRRTVTCSLNPDQGNVTLPPRLDSITVRTTMANGTSELSVLPARSNDVRNHSTFPPGAVSQEFVCRLLNKPKVPGFRNGTHGRSESRR